MPRQRPSLIVPVTLAVDRDPWERQPHEPDKAWAAFSIYRNMGIWERSWSKVRAQLELRSMTSISNWAKRWRWTARIEAWDAKMDREAFQAQVSAVREMNDRHARLAMTMIGKVAQRLVGDEVAGVSAIDPNKLSAGDIARMAEVATKIERIAQGEETERVKIEAPDEGIRLKVGFEFVPQFPGEPDGTPPPPGQPLQLGEVAETARIEDTSEDN